MNKEFKHNYLPLTARWQEEPKGYAIYDSSEYVIELVEQEKIENSNEWQKVNLKLIKGRWYERVSDGLRFRCSGKDNSDSFFIGDNAYKKGISAIEIKEDRNTVFIPELTNLEFRELTAQEIHETLNMICKYKGLVKGVKAKTPNPKMIFNFSGETEIQFDDNFGYMLKSKYENMLIYDPYLGWAEKVEEPILLTEDNVEVYDKNEYVFEANLYFNSPLCHSAFEINDEKINGKIFKYKENAQDYIENYELKFSKADLKWLEKMVEYFSNKSTNMSEFTINIQMHIESLRQSK